MKIGVLGLGYWGPNLVRNFLAQNNVKEVIACDLEANRLNFVKEKLPAAKLTNNWQDLISSNIDAIAIATPVDTHYNFAKKALMANKHIWVEKPFTSTSAQAMELINIADSRNLKIFVDHTFIYTGAVRKMKELVESGELGKILYFDSVRINLGLFQKDINVIWDLAPHDLSIMNYVIGNGHKATALSAHGIANYNGKENIGHLSIYFEDKCFAHFHVNWVSPVKIRQMIIGCDKKMLVFNDMENFEKIKVYNSGVEITTTESIHEALIQYRTGDMYSPKVVQTEALTLAAKEFVEAICENRQPLTNGIDGLNVVKILEASDLSMRNKGELVEIGSMELINK